MQRIIVRARTLPPSLDRIMCRQKFSQIASSQVSPVVAREHFSKADLIAFKKNRGVRCSERKMNKILSFCVLYCSLIPSNRSVSHYCSTQVKHQGWCLVFMTWTTHTWVQETFCTNTVILGSFASSSQYYKLTMDSQPLLCHYRHPPL